MLRKKGSKICFYINDTHFKERWESILSKSFEKTYAFPYEDTNDDYFIETPIEQDFLTEQNTVCSYDVDYIDYFPQSSDQFNAKNLQSNFLGILNYIASNSCYKLNKNEITFHFSGARNRNSFCKSSSDKSDEDEYDDKNILNLLSYEKLNKEFQIEPCLNAFFGITFNRIKIRPIAYSIRSGLLNNNSSHLVSFKFEGYDEQLNKWITLDERVNDNSLIPDANYATFFVKTTNQCFSSFRIVQTEPSSNRMWGFVIAAFEIHGDVYYRDNNYISQNDEILNDSFVCDDEQEFYLGDLDDIFKDHDFNF